MHLFDRTRREWLPVALTCALALALVAALALVPAVQAQDGDGGDDSGAEGEAPAEEEGPYSDGDYSSPDDCATCHKDEYHEWEQSTHANALTNPLFLEAWSRAGEPTYCRSCHATGYDAVEGTIDYEGVGCLSCHEFSTEDDGPHMTTDKSAELCGNCHTGIHAPDYDEWLTSDHAAANVDCADCHFSHTADLRMESSTALCSSCHEAEATSSVHGGDGMECTDCHMAQGDEIVDAISQRRDGSGHSFAIPSDVCSDCHGMTHSITASEDEVPMVATETALEDCQAEGEQQANTKLNLGLTGGGIGGLLVGIAIPFLTRRRKDQ